LDSRQTALLSKKLLLRKSKEVGTDLIWQNVLRKAMGKKDCSANDNDDVCYLCEQGKDVHL
jgi:hypothetical protein